MRRRPGDIPEFLCSLVIARDIEKNRVLAGSMRLLFGPDPDRCTSPGYWKNPGCAPCNYENQFIINTLPPTGEYDGR